MDAFDSQWLNQMPSSACPSEPHFVYGEGWHALIALQVKPLVGRVGLTYKSIKACCGWLNQGSPSA
jgi:hypothetical protein